MDKETRERFERIDSRLERMSERMEAIQTAHLELEAAQKLLTLLLSRTHTESDQRMRALDERLNILIGIVERHITDQDAHRRSPGGEP
jgi:hypothetical protein